jgi:hypothetical protein
LADIKAPTLILTGDRDTAIPRSNSDLLAAIIPNLKLEIIADAAHGFSYSHADTTADLIHLFLQQPPNPEKTIMKDQLDAIRDTFVEYAEAFNLLEPTQVEPFFQVPSILMTSDLVVVMKESNEVIRLFTVLMDELEKKSFKESNILESLQVSQLSNNQGQVVGVAKRFNKSKEEIEHFGFTYTLRKVEAKWKIIAGVLHEPETLSNS